MKIAIVMRRQSRDALPPFLYAEKITKFIVNSFTDVLLPKCYGSLRTSVSTRAQRIFLFSACRSCWLFVWRYTKKGYVFLVENHAERQSQGNPRGNALARFLGSFFAARQRMNIQSRTASACEAQCERRLRNFLKNPPREVPHDTPLPHRHDRHERRR